MCGHVKEISLRFYAATSLYVGVIDILNEEEDKQKKIGMARILLPCIVCAPNGVVENCFSISCGSGIVH